MASDLRAEYDRLAAEGRITPDPAQLAVLPHLQSILDWSATRPEPARKGLFGLFAPKPEPVPKGLYLWGGVGRGKSMLMDLFAGIAECPRRRVHFNAFMQEVQDGLHEVRKTGVDDALKPVADRVASQIRLLAFDEMQITDIADAMIVGRFFKILLDQGVVIVTTSNRPPDDLYKDGLNRALFLPFIALLKERMAVHELASPTDFRQLRLAGERSYFTPADARARAEIDRLWAELNHAASEPLTLKVKGREVVIPDYREGEARVSFWDLCGRPLGAADYLALAGAVRLLILEDVPQLSAENYNAARRFVTLIDTLYEAKTRLIVTAAAEPEKLYVEGEGSFEFARTASRLREMMSDGWGAQD